MREGLDSDLRPDLSKILARPVVLRNVSGVGAHLQVQRDAAGPDYLVDVRRDLGPAADETGFGIAQARAVAEKLATRLQQPDSPRLHAFERERLGPLLD
ncbi:MAG: hypothetical protein NXI31_03385 [bacterium]|nr:hypothetical protein [bacterium]